MKKFPIILVLFALFSLIFRSNSVLAGSGGQVRYNCVSGVHKAECAQICENLRIAVGDLPDPLAGFRLTHTPVEKDRIRREELPYYCQGTPITQAQKTFVGMPKPTLRPTATLTPAVPTDTPATPTAPPASAAPPADSPKTVQNIFILIFDWFKNLFN